MDVYSRIGALSCCRQACYWGDWHCQALPCREAGRQAGREGGREGKNGWMDGKEGKGGSEMEHEGE